jgi:thiamine biosynthesis lipoprotein
LRRCRPLVGTLVEIEADDCAAIDLAFAAVERTHALMSAHDPRSELGLINRFAHRRPVAVSDWTARVIERALHWSRASGGRFDVVRAGRAALDCGGVPRHEDQPLPNGGDWEVIQLAGRTVSLDQPACLDLGGIAKGFAVDRAIEVLMAAGLSRGLVNAGGDLRGFGAEPWPVTVVDPASRNPLASIELVNSALATSAGIRGEGNALSFDHLPKRDLRWTSVTVRSPVACDADALAKIVWSGTGEAGACLRSVGAAAFTIRVDGQIEAVSNEVVAA